MPGFLGFFILAFISAVFFFISKKERWPFITFMLGFLYWCVSFAMDAAQRAFDCLPFMAMNMLYLNRSFCLLWGILTVENRSEVGITYIGFTLYIAYLIFIIVGIYGLINIIKHFVRKKRG